MQATVSDLQSKFHKAKPTFYPSRQRFSLPLKAGEKKATSLAAGKKLSDYDVKDGSVLIFKDLGPQVQPHLLCLCGQCMLPSEPSRYAYMQAKVGRRLAQDPGACGRLATRRCSSGSTLAPWWSMLSSTSCRRSSTPPTSILLCPMPGRNSSPALATHHFV